MIFTQFINSIFISFDFCFNFILHILNNAKDVLSFKNFNFNYIEIIIITHNILAYLIIENVKLHDFIIKNIHSKVKSVSKLVSKE